VAFRTATEKLDDLTTLKVKPPDYPRPEPDYFWIPRWSQRRDAVEYISIARQALEGIDLSYHSKFCIFNCSDGPSSFGLVSQIVEFSLKPLILLSDVSDYAVAACQEYIGNRIPVDLLAIPSDTENLVAALEKIGQSIDVFISFEPIGDLVPAFKDMFDYLPESGMIVVCSRGYPGVQPILKTGKRLGIEPFIYNPGIETFKGPLIAAVLAKKS